MEENKEMKNYDKIAATLIMEEVAPRLKKGGIMPDPIQFSMLVQEKTNGRLSTLQIRDILDGLMFK